MGKRKADCTAEEWEEIARQQKVRRERHEAKDPEHAAKVRREYRKRNSNAANERAKGWYEQNKEYANERSKQYAVQNRERINKQKKEKRRTRSYAEKRNIQLKRDYGITLQQYNEMLETQGGVCAICKKTCSRGKQLCVDHCHVTGEVRMLLCPRCNVGLGSFGDDPALLKEAIQYLQRHQLNGTQRITTEQSDSHESAGNSSSTGYQPAT